MDEQVGTAVEGAVPAAPEVAPAGEALKSAAIEATEKATADAAAANKPAIDSVVPEISSVPAPDPAFASRVAEMTHAELASFAHSLHLRLEAIEAWIKSKL